LHQYPYLNLPLPNHKQPLLELHNQNGCVYDFTGLYDVLKTKNHILKL
jgi:hypothetical protein